MKKTHIFNYAQKLIRNILKGTKKEKIENILINVHPQMSRTST